MGSWILELELEHDAPFVYILDLVSFFFSFLPFFS